MFPSAPFFLTNGLIFKLSKAYLQSPPISGGLRSGGVTISAQAVIRRGCLMDTITFLQTEAFPLVSELAGAICGVLLWVIIERRLP